MKMVRMLFAALFAVVCAWKLLAADYVPTRVNLTSEPAGASIFVDGQLCGTTPRMFFDLKPGAHLVKYRLTGYIEKDFLLEVSAAAPVDHNEVLEEERGLLIIKTDPEGCNIKVDGLSVGESPRLLTTLTTKDTHRIVLSKAGYQSQTVSVKFNGREPLVREEKLILDSGVVDFVTDPPGAEVMVNGIVRGRTPLVVNNIPKGSTIIKFRMDGFKEVTRELRMNAGDRETLSVALTGLPGTLHLLSIPADASFYVNGVARGRSPLSIPGLEPGDYQVRCEKEGYETISRVITIRNGASAREEFKLSNVMGRIELRTSPAEAEVLLDGCVVGSTRAVGAETVSAILLIENVMEGEHTLVVRKDGYKDISGTIRVEAKETAHPRVIYLKRAFIPNVEVTTVNETIRGVFKNQNESTLVIETKPGLEYPIPRQFIRKIQWLDR